MATPQSIKDATVITQLLNLAMGGEIAEDGNIAEAVYVDGVRIWPDPGGRVSDVVDSEDQLHGQRWSGKVLWEVITSLFDGLTIRNIVVADGSGITVSYNLETGTLTIDSSQIMTRLDNVSLRLDAVERRTGTLL